MPNDTSSTKISRRGGGPYLQFFFSKFLTGIHDLESQSEVREMVGNSHQSIGVDDVQSILAHHLRWEPHCSFAYDRRFLDLLFLSCHERLLSVGTKSLYNGSVTMRWSLSEREVSRLIGCLRYQIPIRYIYQKHETRALTTRPRWVSTNGQVERSSPSRRPSDTS